MSALESKQLAGIHFTDVHVFNVLGLSIQGVSAQFQVLHASSNVKCFARAFLQS